MQIINDFTKRMLKEFKAIEGCYPYMVSHLGHVCNCETKKILKSHCNARGYLKIQLKGKCRYIHILVLEAYKGPRPKGAQGCHGPDGPLNNNINNLRWDTPENNYKDKRKPVAKGEQVYTAKLTTRNVKEIRRLSKIGVSTRQIAKIFDVTHSTVGNILKGKRWGHVK